MEFYSNTLTPREQFEAERESQNWNDLEHLQDVLKYYSGYFRQAAVERCEKLGLPGALPFVASRLNDWVPQVRQAARKAVLAMLDGASLSEQLATLVIVQSLRNAGRVDHGEWISEFELKFLSTIGKEDLWNAFKTGPRKQSRTCFDLIRRHAFMPIEQLLEYGVGSRVDIVLAARSVEFAAQLDAPARSAVLKRGLDSHFGAVRRAALQLLLAQGEAGAMVNECLLDKHATVRSLAMSHLASRQFDLKDFYREALNPATSPAANIRIALLSLAALGSVEDLDAIKAYTSAASAGVRLAAYMGWLRLVPSEKDTLVLLAFADVAPSIRKFARMLLERYGAYANFADLYRLLGPSDDLFKVIFMVRSHKWNWLEAIAMLARDTPLNSHVAAELARELRSWISSARWERHRPIGKQGEELSDPATMAHLEALIAGESELIEQLRGHIALGTAN
ncbi:hypothetical protein [Duganella sp. Root1480D1]|uniref:hypothetical protein n=1 Tax=Duganella sp. Root1480D1 TaxID=1736471 RepID=UPI0007098F76|nr:hypothetical protein [Duganella sp. Root1480D1]KQZ41486.1 hypothetical protein ASD58_26310 [Duganella sp. Root1480D1]